MPLKLKVILVGERESLADFQEMEPELSEQAIYSEFEDTLQIVDAESVTQWCRWVTFTARHNHLPAGSGCLAGTYPRSSTLHR